MNNSMKRMIDGMVATLREEVIPNVSTEFARGQAFGVIYMLNSLALRASWSPEFLCEQVAAQADLGVSLAPLLTNLDAPRLPKAAVAGAGSAALEALRDDNEACICALIDWHGTAELETDKASRIEAGFRVYMDRQLKHELKTSAKPMFAEISAGAE